MAISQKIIPFNGVELDNHELNVDEMRAVFIKNFTHDVNDNSRVVIGEGQNAYVHTPLLANTRYCNLPLPAGTNYCCGFHYVKDVNHAFVFGYNNNGQHFFYRINATTGQCQMVLIDPCLNWQLDPQYFISETRCVSQVICRNNPVTGEPEKIVYLIVTDNFNDQRFFCPEDLISTNGFNANDFPYFNTDDADCTRCNWFNLGVPTPSRCISVTPVERDLDDEDEKTKPNLINYKGWEFRTKETDVWNRATEHGNISEPYFNQIGNSCLANSSGLARCLRLRIPAGCPLTDKIQISYRNCNGNIKGLSIETDWYRHTIINKYKECDNVNWWNRTINNPWQDEYDQQIIDGATPEEAAAAAYALGLLRYYAIDNTFEYTFCANKECAPIAVAETNRIENPLPLTSGSVFPLNKSIGLARNRRGFEPMDCNELNKVEFSVEPPNVNSCSRVVLKKIEIWGIFYNPNNQVITRIRTQDAVPVFGYADCENNNPINFGQKLPEGQEGIIGHLKGTDYYTISKQYRYDTLTDTLEYVGFDWTTLGGDDSGRYIPVQKWELSVIPGKYRFHLASHNDKPTDNYKASSTNFIGRTDLLGIGNLVAEEREIIVDVCTNDFLLKDTPIMIWDLTHKGKNCTTSSQAASAVAGYMYEDEIGKQPITMAAVETNHDGDVFKSSFTDHNGFYFATRNGRVLQATIRGYKSCVSNQVLAVGRGTLDTVDNWFKLDRLYAYKNTTPYPVGDRMIIEGRVSLCGSPTIGVPGVLVNLTRAGYAITDANGEYRIVMHDIGNSSFRTEQIIISQKGSCQILTCDTECKFCFPLIPVNKIACTGLERIITITDITVRINVINSKGPKMGGRYGLCMFLHDWMGRRSFAQATEKYYIDIPSLQQTQVYDYSKIFFDLNNAVFAPWVKKITFGITENLNWDDDLVWVSERVQFVDNTGKTNTAAPTQIRLFYESLAEYNKQYDFSTNTVWQVLTDEQNSIQGDLIEFLANADGSIFSKRITALAKYNKEGKYIQIDYTEDLKDLKDGTLIKLIRQKDCLNKEFFYELCPSIPVVGQQATIQSGQLNFFDSYMLYRQIPVPTLITTIVDDVVTSATENQIVSYPFFFEHHSPSDTWGDHCSYKGRVGVKNPSEKEQCRNTEMCVSDAIVNAGEINGLHRIREENIIVLDEQEWGGITAVFSEINTLLVLFEHDNAVLTYNDDNVRVDSQGNVVATPGANRFSRPERKIGNNFGCQPDDINTIRSYKGLVFFLDSNNAALVVHNYAEARDITISDENKGGYKSFIASAVKNVLQNNNTPGNKKRYWHGVIDCKNKKFILTVATINQLSGDYVNDRLEPSVIANETIAVNIYGGALKTFLSFTPEYYGSVEGDKDDEQLLSFRFGEAWKHHRIINPGDIFNRFYNINVNKVMEVVYNIDNTKVKKFMWTEVYCPQALLYCDRIITESGQVSRLMPRWFEKFEKFWSADFKCATNTQADANLPEDTGVNALLDGEHLYGRWMRVRYIGKSADINKYCELTAIVGYMNGSEKSGAGK